MFKKELKSILEYNIPDVEITKIEYKIVKRHKRRAFVNVYVHFKYKGGVGTYECIGLDIKFNLNYYYVNIYRC